MNQASSTEIVSACMRVTSPDLARMHNHCRPNCPALLFVCRTVALPHQFGPALRSRASWNRPVFVRAIILALTNCRDGSTIVHNSTRWAITLASSWRLRPLSQRVGCAIPTGAETQRLYNMVQRPLPALRPSPSWNVPLDLMCGPSRARK